MKRLPANYVSILETIENKYDLDTIRDYNEMIKVYYNINKILEEHNCEIYDLNCVLREYTIDTKYLPIVKKLRKFVNRKNRGIAKQVVKSDKWNRYVKDLQKENKKEKKLIEKSLLRTMKPYSKNWMGYWSIIDISEKGIIKDINLFSPDDYNLFMKNLKDV